MRVCARVCTLFVRIEANKGDEMADKWAKAGTQKWQHPLSTPRGRQKKELCYHPTTDHPQNTYGPSVWAPIGKRSNPERPA